MKHIDEEFRSCSPFRLIYKGVRMYGTQGGIIVTGASAPVTFYTRLMVEAPHYQPHQRHPLLFLCVSETLRTTTIRVNRSGVSIGLLFNLTN